jgi:opacity protein-like surface antigen
MMKISVLTLLASTVLSGAAVAADMAVKAPRPAEAIYNDWSGIYTGVAAGGAWGRERLSNDLSTFDTATASSQLFGTSTARIFNGTAAIIQPPFSMSDCLISNCNTSKMSGFIAGGFAGAQKQLGNWVIGIEGSWDFLGLKKSFSASEDSVENVTRFVPTTTFTTAPTPITTAPTPVLIPAQNVIVPGQTAPVTVTVGPQGVQVNSTFNLGPVPAAVIGTTLPAGTFAMPVVISNGAAPSGGPIAPSTQIVTLTNDAPVTVVAGPGGTGQITIHQVLGGNVTVGPGSIVSSITTTGGTGTGTATIAATPITIPAQTITVPGQTVTVPGQNITVALPQATTVRAAVTRTADLSTKVDQIVDLRGKFGIAFGPSWLLYVTGGGAVGHFEKSLSITQTTALCTTQVGACVTTGQASRSDTFSAHSADTRLGWVVGAGLDWKPAQNFVLGVLYRHHEFPKGTVSFSDGTNSLGFGTARASVDSVQGRLSWLFPIQ